MTLRRKICVVTGTRAEYGLLHGLMKETAASGAQQLQIIVTGMHLSPEFGLTFRQIETDGFVIDAKVEMLLSSDTVIGVAKSMGIGIIGFADALDRLRPDILVLLGDRFEMLVAAQVALVARIPIAHLHGGETTQGAFDESIRHAITKMAQWHFVAAEPYRRRVVQMGEAPDRVFNVGAPGLDQIHRLAGFDRGELEAAVGFPLRAPLFLVTYHPATLNDRSPVAAVEQLLMALDDFADATVIFTHSNADPGGRAIIDRISAWVEQHSDRAQAYESLGQRRYLSMLREADVVIGNSSSALIEAPILKTATVNIGTRQQGRLKATSVIDAAEEKAEISAAIRKALSDDFQQSVVTTTSLYDHGNVAKKISAILGAVPLTDRKQFFDIDHE